MTVELENGVNSFFSSFGMEYAMFVGWKEEEEKEEKDCFFAICLEVSQSSGNFGTIRYDTSILISTIGI